MSLDRGSIDDDSLGAAWQELAEQAAQQAAQGKPWLLKLLVERSAALAARYALWKQRLQQLRLGERRRLQRRLGVGLAGAALLLALSSAPTAWAGAPIVVDGTTCTLTNAIVSANTDSAVGGCTTGYAGADTIDLQVDVSLTASNNATYGPTGLPVVTSQITIEGNGHTISRDGSATTETFRIMAVGSGGTLTLNSATISGGVATGSGNASNGGGIFANSSATVAVSNSTLANNTAVYGGGIYVSRYAMVTVSNSTLSGNSVSQTGGGIYTNTATLAVSNSTFSGNSASYHGGGIYADYSTVTVSNSTLSGNSAVKEGGGIYAEGGTWTVSNSTLANNTAEDGGGIYAGNTSTVTVTNSTLSGNSVSYYGGGIYVDSATVTVSNSTLSGNSARGGGGIKAYYGTVAVTNSTLSGNSAIVKAGGIYTYYGTVMVTNSTLSGNSANTGGCIYARTATLAVTNSTLSGNSAAYGGCIYARDYATLVVTNSTLSGNAAAYKGGGIYTYSGAVTLQRSLVSGNAAGVSANEVYNNGSTITAANFNLFGHDGEYDSQAFYGFAPGATDINATYDGDSVALATILTTTLADNDSTVLAGAPPGSIVQTLALPTGSPAIDKAPSADCLAAPTNGLDQRGKARNADGNGAASSNECDIGAFELQAAVAPIPRIVIQKQTLPNGDTTPFQFKLRGPVNRSFTLTDDGIKGTGLIPSGVYTLEEILPPGWTPAIPLDQLTCDDGSPIAAIDLGASEVVVCRFLNYKGGNLIIKKVTIPAVASPSFSMRLINNTTNAKQTFSLAHNQQFDSGALDTAATYKLLETVPGGWKRKNIICDNGSPSTSITPAAGGTVTCTVTNENSAPSGIQLSSNSLKENQPVGTVIGTLSAGDSVAGDTHTFTFVDDGSAGASGNSKFQIAGKQLKSAAVFDYETKTSYNIKLKVTDSAGQTAVKNFVVQILNAPN